MLIIFEIKCINELILLCSTNYNEADLNGVPMWKNNTGYKYLVFLVIALCVTVFFSFMIGKYSISPNEIMGILASKILPIKQYWTDQMETVFFQIRFPRILMSVLVGGALASAGACYQGVFQNPMAAPDILGASTGAAFGAALAILMHGSKVMITASAFFFSILSVILVLIFSKKSMGSKILAFVLSGMMIGSLFSAGTSFIKLVADPTDQLPSITYWLMGSLSGSTSQSLKFVFWVMIGGWIPIYLVRWKMNLLTLGDEEAQTMGIKINRIRIVIIVAATLLTAAAVSVSGIIGWVGLIIPHLARRMVGGNFRYLIPCSMLLGGWFLLLVDNLSRSLFTSEIPIGILTALVGAPFFLYLLSGRGEKV